MPADLSNIYPSVKRFACKEGRKEFPELLEPSPRHARGECIAFIHHPLSVLNSKICLRIHERRGNAYTSFRNSNIFNVKCEIKLMNMVCCTCSEHSLYVVTILTDKLRASRNPYEYSMISPISA